MPSDYELSKTFFPSTRKELIATSITLLETKGNEKRLKLSIIMPLEDEKLVGMPRWVGDSYDVICKDDSLLTEDSWGHKIKEMIMNTYTTDDGERPKHIMNCPIMTSFKLRREKRSEDEDLMPEIFLSFYAYVVASQPLWTWFYEKRGQSIYVRFETTQKELPLGEVDDKQMKLGENKDAFEDERQEATSPEHDDEFARIN